MRFYSMISVVCLVLLGAIGTSAQEKPSFTGTWKMNLEKSTLSDGKPIPYYTEFIHEIDHKEPKFRLTEKIKARPEAGGDRTVLWDVTTDGKEYETKVGDARAKVSVSWNNNQLVQRIAGEDWQVVRTSILYDAEEKNFRRFADFIIHGVVPEDLKGTDTSADA